MCAANCRTSVSGLSALGQPRSGPTPRGRPTNREPKHRRTSLPLRELEPLPRLRTTGLLALDRACVAGEQAKVAQLATVRLVDLHQRARDGESERTGLTGLTTTGHVGLHVVLAEPVGCRERLLDRGHQCGTRKVVTERPPIDVPLAAAGLEVHAADRLL